MGVYEAGLGRYKMLRFLTSGVFWRKHVTEMLLHLLLHYYMLLHYISWEPF